MEETNTPPTDHIHEETFSDKLTYFGYRCLGYGLNTYYCIENAVRDFTSYFIDDTDDQLDFYKIDLSFMNRLLLNSSETRDDEEHQLQYVNFRYKGQYYHLFLSRQRGSLTYLYKNVDKLDEEHNHFLNAECLIYKNMDGDEEFATEPIDISSLLHRCLIDNTYLPFMTSLNIFWTETLFKEGYINNTLKQSILRNPEQYTFILKTIDRNVNVHEYKNVIFYVDKDGILVTYPENSYKFLEKE